MKRNKILAALVAGVMTLSAVGFGFSAWSSNISLNGNVVAKGNWDVAITDAAIKSISTATAVNPTAKVTVYPVTAQIFTSGDTSNWRMLIDDTNPSEIEVTAAELAEYTRGYTFNNTSNVYNFLASNGRWGGSFNVKVNELGEKLGLKEGFTTNGNVVAEGEDTSAVGQVIGQAICSWNNKNVTRPNVTIPDTYTVAEAALAAAEKEIAPTVEVTAYNVYAHRYNENASIGDVYRYQIDDVNPITIAVSMDDLETFDKGDVNVSIPGSGPPQYSFYTSGKYTSVGSGSVFYRMWFTDLGRDLGFTTTGTTGVDCTDNGAHDGELIAVALCSSVANNRQNPWGIVPQLDSAKSALSAMEPTVIYPATVSEDGLTATYANAEMTLPGAWAEYTVTITNNGTANANLNEYALNVVTEGVVVVDAPELTDEVLAPGASCTVTFVAQVPAEYEGALDENASINVNLVYAQDVVEPAPVAAHTH